jgi:hypothetical protein
LGGMHIAARRTNVYFFFRTYAIEVTLIWSSYLFLHTRIFISAREFWTGGYPILFIAGCLFDKSMDSMSQRGRSCQSPCARFESTSRLFWSWIDSLFYPLPLSTYLLPLSLSMNQASWVTKFVGKKRAILWLSYMLITARSTYGMTASNS